MEEKITKAFKGKIREVGCQDLTCDMDKDIAWDMGKDRGRNLDIFQEITQDMGRILELIHSVKG